MENLLSFGPMDEPVICDDFSYEDVRGSHCLGNISKRVGSHFIACAAEDTRYLCICVPCYNEDLEELMKTISSLMENIEFMQRKARLYEDEAGIRLKSEFLNTIPIIVPIFDGVKAMAPSMKTWVESNFPNAFRGLDDGKASGPGVLDAKVVCRRWWYYCDDTLPPDVNVNTPAAPLGAVSRHSQSIVDRLVKRVYNNEDSLGRSIGKSPLLSKSRKVMTEEPSRKEESNLASLRMTSVESKATDDLFHDETIIYFYVTCIIKRSNHRKHNSHQWFFDSVCRSLGSKTSLAFLTDCGTTFNTTCLARLIYEIRFRPDLIGVTARQRVETPGPFFHPCESSGFSCLRGDHSASGDPRPCWKCYATYYLSPAPLQGFEFEATLIMNSAMFNLVEALPVMPGPCQLLNWDKMKEFRIVDEYFNLLFKGEPKKGDIPKLPKRYCRMAMTSVPLHLSVDQEDNPLLNDIERAMDQESKSIDEVRPSVAESIFTDRNTMVLEKALSTPPEQADGITFTEFLRVNMRLAEDRILSFVCVFSTGFGTKWIPGATFFYQPEVRWQTLLTQRRRWLNGTFASFLFFFNSKRARERINGGMFDGYKAGRNIRFVDGLWALQLMQLLLVLIAPAVFGSASYVGFCETARILNMNSWLPYRAAEGWAFLYGLVYGVWTLRSFFAPRGNMPESVCVLVALFGLLYVFPVYFSVWNTIFMGEISIVDAIVMVSLFLPALIATGQSYRSAYLYLFYLPWFLALIMFFLVFIPSYSFARLWDTTWGNRATGNDSAITDKMVDIMKSRNLVFITFLVIANVLLMWAFIRVARLGYVYVLGFMFVVFFPMIVQMILAIYFLFVAIPLRYFFGER